MTADIKQDDLLLGDQQRQSDAVAVGQTHGVATGEFTGERVQPERGLKGVALQVFEEPGKRRAQVGVFLEKLAGLTQKLLRHDQAEHLHRLVAVEGPEEIVGAGEGLHLAGPDLF